MVFRLNILIVIFTICVYCASAQTTHVKCNAMADSVLLLKLQNEVIRSQASLEDSLMTLQDIAASWDNSKIDGGVIKYAPDNSFKIVTFIFESCGAYCNSEWFSWVCFCNGAEAKIKKVNFGSIDTIYKLNDNKYLVIENYGSRPASVLTLYCMKTNLISFEGDSIISHQINYYNTNFDSNSFGFCQENGVTENQPFIKYDGGSKTLNYHFANNFAYSNNLDLDTIREGQFVYIGGSFILHNETVTAQDNSTLPTKTNKWTENYKISNNDTLNIHIKTFKGFQLVYDCLGCSNYYSNALKISAIYKNNKKTLLTLPTNGAFLEKIKVLKIQGSYFIYISTFETSGNTDGYLFYLNTQTMLAHKVIAPKTNLIHQKDFEPTGKYAYLSFNDNYSEIFTASKYINTKNNQIATVITPFNLLKINANKYILKPLKSTMQFDD